MSVGNMVLLAASFVFALAASWMLLLPFFRHQPEIPGEDSSEISRENLMERKDSLIQALEDLEADYQSDRVSREDYEASKAELSGEAAEYIARIDALSK